jgi:3-oxoacyl-[acyl-carrier protein] reductase
VSPAPEQSGRVALVTGAGGGAEGGIGAAVARLLAAAGGRIAVNDVSRHEAEATAEQLRAGGAEAEAFVADIADSVAASAMVAAVAERFGGLDVLVNNAGIVGAHSIESTPDEEWHRVIGVNLDGPFFTTRAAIPHLKRSTAGRVVFVASIAGTRIGTLGGASYSASKAGVLGFMRHLAAEVGRDGITANAVLPGMVMTPLVEQRTSEQSKRDLYAMVPVGRGASPEEIAAAVVFLADPKCGYANGAELTIDGGRTVLPGAFAQWAKAAGLDETE